MRNRRANNFPPIPRKVEEFDNLMKNPDFVAIDGNIFYRTFGSANDEFALIFLAGIDLSFLNRIHSIQVDAIFKTVLIDFYQLLFMVNSAGLIPKSKVFIALGKRLGQKRPNFWFFLFKLKNVGITYQLEANQLREGILPRRCRRKMSKASKKFISKAEEKLATGRYTAQEFLQIVSHVTEKSFEEMADEEKIRKILKMTCPL